VEKAKKAEVVEDLNQVFSKAGSVVVAHYSGMTVAQMSDLRSRMRAGLLLGRRLLRQVDAELHLHNLPRCIRHQKINFTLRGEQTVEQTESIGRAGTAGHGEGDGFFSGVRHVFVP